MSEDLIQKEFEIKDYKLIENRLEIKLADENIDCEKAAVHIKEIKSGIEYIKNAEIENSIIYLDLADIFIKYSKVPARFEVFIEIIQENKRYLGKAILNKEVDKQERYKNGIKKITEDNLVAVPFISKDKSLMLLIDRDIKYFNEKYKYRTILKSFKIRNGKLSMQVYFKLLSKVEHSVKGITLEFRNSTREPVKYYIPVKVKRNFIIVRDFDLCKLDYESFYWDFYAEVNIKCHGNEEVMRFRIKRPTLNIRRKIRYNSLNNNVDLPNGYILYPYLTSNNCITLTYRPKTEYDGSKYKIREFIAWLGYKVMEPYYLNKNIYLMYEKFSETAQDNSYYFFKYCREKHPDKNFYFVIDKESKDYERIKDDKNVIQFMSIKHLRYICAAKAFIASESKGHCYAWRVQRGKIRPYLDKKKFIFLQHGVLALKKIDDAFNKNTAGAAELFIVSSNQEKDIVCHYLGYNPEDVAVTGLARWDVVKDKSKELEEKEIFIMPTWRNWMTEVEEEVFVNSEYYQKYMELLNSRKLQKMLEKYNLRVNYFLHPKFKEHLSNFSTENSRINIIEPNTTPINELLMRASLLVTDYSSVALEMFYQKKPTLFYQFDIKDYELYQGSYIDMDTELFGYRVMNVDELVEKIEDYLADGFAEKQQFDIARSRYFEFTDRNNCERIYNAISEKINLGNEEKVSIITIIKQKIQMIMKKISQL